MQGGHHFIVNQQTMHQATSRALSHTAVSSTTPSEDSEGIGSSLADLDSLTDLLPMMAPDVVSTYSSNKIRKTQNEHLVIICQNLIGL